MDKLPEDLFHRVINVLPAEDVGRLEAVCKAINQRLKHDHIWKGLYCRRWHSDVLVRSCIACPRADNRYEIE